MRCKCNVQIRNASVMRTHNVGATKRKLDNSQSTTHKYAAQGKRMEVHERQVGERRKNAKHKRNA